MGERAAVANLIKRAKTHPVRYERVRELLEPFEQYRRSRISFGKLVDHVRDWYDGKEVDTALTIPELCVSVLRKATRPLSTMAIANTIGRNYNATYIALKRLATRGEVENVGRATRPEWKAVKR